MDEREKTLSAAVMVLREELCRADVRREIIEPLFDLVLVTIAGGRAARVPVTRGRQPIDTRIARVLAAVRSRISERWTIERMAKLAGMSRAAFVRLFTATAGLPPLTYVTRLRIDVAKALLAETDEAAAAIAERVGYGSVYAFSRAFTRLTGRPPVLFRRTARSATLPITGRATMMRLAA